VVCIVLYLADFYLHSTNGIQISNHLFSVTLQLSIVNIFAVKWPKFRLKILVLGDSVGVPPQKGDDIQDMCTIIQNFTLIRATIAEISVTKLKNGQSNSKLSTLSY